MTNGFVSYLKQLKITAYSKPSAVMLGRVLSVKKAPVSILERDMAKIQIAINSELLK